ncbi:hypothetical protein, unlikely [Trypanosoma brucei gambiense DAL972]|uniref:Uncharacterized protein n=1 Tax=Trypanosoma brucei gambiense (strain MHOM/CI/86/DAL972) TaxID=679716 RepID=C9ZI33_TRYB9|nr:hypothetical protein, unlikely [Trypanosoma brucei gambiense DAL972]CBH09150.1 hypothetical protein, unlikely [Trypanosoma brucei gambiense DAL972]|eukprot:XP_011771591.1 hypothetical protein, unlikely [Trypanosoma brucei gambiense DAL972]
MNSSEENRRPCTSNYSFIYLFFPFHTIISLFLLRREQKKKRKKSFPLKSLIIRILIIIIMEPALSVLH